MSYPVSATHGSSNPAYVNVGSGAAKPPKYSGGKINPAWVAWNEAQNRAQGSNAPGTTVPSKAPPVVCSMEEKSQLEEDIGKEVPFTPKLEKTFEEIQDPKYASSVGLNPDDMVDELGTVMAKYEIPMGLASKLTELSSFDLIEFILDDSGSMRRDTDSKDVHGRARTRKDEALSRILEMVEVISYLKIPPIKFRFINHQNRECCLELVRRGERPADFFERSRSEVEKMWRKPTWENTTPMKEALQKSFNDSVGKRVVRYVFGDGVPDNQHVSIPEIERMFMSRKGSKDNPVTFMSCTDKDEDVEWMKNLEEKAQHCSESDDYNDEKKEVCADQGEAFPYTKGFYIVCELVAAMNPDDLDCMDESVPYSKSDFDLLQGYVSEESGYKKYFDGFLEAQRVRSRLPNPSKEDKIKTSMDWKGLYNELCRQKHASDISAARAYRDKIRAA